MGKLCLAYLGEKVVKEKEYLSAMVADDSAICSGANSVTSEGG